MITIREFTMPDVASCLGAFRSNVPAFFGAYEQSEYAAFLERLPCRYFVAELGGTVVGGGGFYIVQSERLASLVWGMVSRESQRQGVGTALLRVRLEHIACNRSVRFVRAKASQYSAPFLQRFGFYTDGIIEHRFGHGLHQHDMYLRLPSRQRREIA